ncbi:MAG TPA: NAD(P)H-binding protein [Actinomycetota bacterium]|nr:NAD(P)H-binding protein [Actinomycetota bacterium]
MILVAGGTGRLGSILVPSLTAGGIPVRVMARRGERADAIRAAGAEFVAGDVRDAAAVRAAASGATVVVSAVHGMSGVGRGRFRSIDVRGNRNLTEAAQTAGASVVLVSVVGASADNPMALFRAKSAAEEQVRASACPWTIVRATAYAELWAELVGKGLIFGRGDNAINFVSVLDVAAVVERAVLDPTLRGQVLDVAGPENLSFNQFAGVLREMGRLDRPVRHVPRGLLRALAHLDPRAASSLVMDAADLAVHTVSRPDGVAVTPLRVALAQAVRAMPGG